MRIAIRETKKNNSCTQSNSSGNDILNDLLQLFENEGTSLPSKSTDRIRHINDFFLEK